MKTLLVIAAIVGGLYFYPQINEGSSSACGAVEKRFVREAFSASQGGDLFIGLLMSGASNGALAQAMVKSASPNLPAFLGCLKAYYQLMLDPEPARQAFSQGAR